MPYINLIQDQRLAARRDDRKSKTLFTAFIGSMAASVAAFVLVSFDGQRLQDEEAALQAQIERAKPLIARTEANRREMSVLLPRLTTLEDAQQTSDRWHRVLQHVSTQTPPETWLTGVRCLGGDPKKAIQVSFQGMSLSQDPVAELILRFQTAADLGNVNLKYTQEKLIEQSKATEFMVEADLKGTEPKKVAEEVQA